MSCKTNIYQHTIPLSKHKSILFPIMPASIDFFADAKMVYFRVFCVQNRQLFRCHVKRIIYCVPFYFFCINNIATSLTIFPHTVGAIHTLVGEMNQPTLICSHRAEIMTIDLLGGMFFVWARINLNWFSFLKMSKSSNSFWIVFILRTVEN